MAATKQRRWKMKISFLRSDSPHRRRPPPPEPLPEFLCPVSGALMADPVIVPSGQSFERCSVQACRELGYLPRLPDGARPDISSLIPNLGLKSAISSWCDANGVDRPAPLSLDAAKDVVRGLVESTAKHHKSQTPPGHSHSHSHSGGGSSSAKSEKLEPLTGGSSESSEKELLKGMADHPQVKPFYAATEVNRRPEPLYLSTASSSDSPAPGTPLPLTTKPSCFSSSSSSDSLPPPPTPATAADEEDEIFTRLKSQQESEQEEGLIALRRITKTSPEMRAVLCTPRILSALRPLLASRYSAIQVNAAAALVNLSLEKQNKVRIVRAGAVPALVDALKGGFPESQEHAAGAVFSLALDDENKTAIGVLGALPPLLHLVARSESGRARDDAALALYHLSLAPANRSKLVKLGAIPTLLALAGGGAARGPSGLANRALIILCNVAAGAEGRAALLDAHGVERMVRTLREAGPTAAEREGSVAVLYALSQGGVRFRGSAKAAGAAEALREVALTGGERAREKAVRMIRMLRERRSGEGFAGLVDEEEQDDEDDDEDEDWKGEQTPPESSAAFRPPPRLAGSKISGANSSEF